MIENEDEPAAQEIAESIPAPKPSLWAHIESDVDRIVAAIEAWYAQHFHRSMIHGTPAISADDKASLIAHVVAASSAKE